MGPAVMVSATVLLATWETSVHSWTIVQTPHALMTGSVQMDRMVPCALVLQVCVCVCVCVCDACVVCERCRKGARVCWGLGTIKLWSVRDYCGGYKGAAAVVMAAGSIRADFGGTVEALHNR